MGPTHRPPQHRLDALLYLWASPNGNGKLLKVAGCHGQLQRRVGDCSIACKHCVLLP